MPKIKRKLIYEEGYDPNELPVDAVVEALRKNPSDKISRLKRGAYKIGGKAYVIEQLEFLYRVPELDNK